VLSAILDARSVPTLCPLRAHPVQEDSRRVAVSCPGPNSIAHSNADYTTRRAADLLLLPAVLVAGAMAKASGLRRGRGASRTFGASYRTTLVGTCVPASTAHSEASLDHTPAAAGMAPTADTIRPLLVFSCQKCH